MWLGELSTSTTQMPGSPQDRCNPNLWEVRPRNLLFGNKHPEIRECLFSTWEVGRIPILQVGKVRVRKDKKCKLQVAPWARGRLVPPPFLRITGCVCSECLVHATCSWPLRPRGQNAQLEPSPEGHLSLVTQTHILPFFLPQDFKDWVQNEWKMWSAKFPIAWFQTLLFLERFVSIGD